MPRCLLMLWMCMLLGSAVADLDAKDRAELERLRAENKMLRTENEMVKTENTALRAASSQQGASTTRSDDLVALLADAERDGAVENATGTSCNWCSAKKCDGHCNKNCWLPTWMLDSKCKVHSNSVFRTILKGVISVGTDQNPKWNIMGGDGYTEKRGTVSCPCNHADGSLMSQEDAIRSITGQVGAIGIPNFNARQSLGQSGDNQRWHGVSWLLRISLATVKMTLCWEKKCGRRWEAMSDAVKAAADSVKRSKFDLGPWAGKGSLTQDIQIDNNLDEMLNQGSESAAGWNAC